MNFDRRRVSGFVTAVSDFMDRIGLHSVWDKYPVDFTHMHTDDKSTSILDHFYVNEGLLEHIVDAGPVHLGDNRSRHSPIMMKVDIGEIPVKEPEPAVARPRRPAWYKATPEQKNEYTVLLEEKLASIPLPVSCDSPCCIQAEHSTSHDSHVMDVMSAVIETSHLCIPLSAKSSSGGK